MGSVVEDAALLPPSRTVAKLDVLATQNGRRLDKTGATDMAPTINALLTAFAPSEPSVVDFGEGTYKISSAIDWVSNVVMRGVGRVVFRRDASFIGDVYMVGNAAVDEQDYTDFGFENITFDGNRQDVSITSITRSGTTATATVSSTSAIGMEDGQTWNIRGADQADYNINATVSNVTATTFDYEVSNSPTSPATGTLILSDRFGCCYFNDSDDTGAGFTFKNCRMENFSRAGMGLHIKGVEDVTIEGSKFIDGGFDLYHSIYLLRCLKPHIITNRFENIEAQCIKVSGNPSANADCLILGNTMEVCQRGINLADFNAGRVIGNSVKNASVAGIRAGIEGESSRRITFIGNDLEDCAIGFDVQASLVSITGGNILNCGTSIHLRNVLYAMIGAGCAIRVEDGTNYPDPVAVSITDSGSNTANIVIQGLTAVCGSGITGSTTRVFLDSATPVNDNVVYRPDLNNVAGSWSTIVSQVGRVKGYPYSTGRSAMTVASDQAKSSTTLGGITGLSASLTAGLKYGFRATLFWTADAAGGHKWAINTGGSLTATAIRYHIMAFSDAALAPVVSAVHAALNGTSGQTGAVAGKTIIEGTITVNAAGSLGPRFAKNAGSGGDTTVLSGSSFEVWETN